MMAIVFALLLILVLLLCWATNLLGLPGNWLMVVATAVYVVLTPAQLPTALGWGTVVILLVLALLGEIVEFVAGALGVTRAGGSRRGALMALVGSFLGGLVGMVIGIPIPLIGPILAALLFAGLGAMAGAALGEVSLGRDLKTSWQIAQLAFWGRLAGTVGKVILGAVMLVVVVAALVF